MGWAILTFSLGSPWPGAAILSIAFAFAHWSQGWKSLVAIVGIAAVMHGLVALTGTLLFAMVVHVAYDVVVGLSIRRQAQVQDAAASSRAASASS